MSTPDRHYNTDKELYKTVSPKRTGIKVNLLEAKDDELLAPAQDRRKQQPADVLRCWSIAGPAASRAQG